MEEYIAFLKERGLSENTQRKYLRDANALLKFTGEREITPELLDDYKRFLLKNHPESSVKSMVIAANKYLEYIGNPCRIPHKDVNYAAIKAPEKELSNEEYNRLLEAAKVFTDDRMYMLIKTLCGAGLQVSELKYVTVKAVYAEEISILCGKRLHTVFLPKKLCEELKRYCWDKKILDGVVFVTRNGNPMDRANILRSMKKICADAGVDSKKVFPQELKNLYLRTYDNMKREIIDQMGL